MQEKNYNYAKKILADLKAHYGFRTYDQLAAMLGVKPSTLSSWKNRNSIDVNLIIRKCKDLNEQWLESGEGPMMVNEIQTYYGSKTDQFKKILLVEEPELHLHHEMLLKLWDAADSETQEEVLMILLKKLPKPKREP